MAKPVTTPVVLTEQIVGVVEVYVGVTPEVVVAPMGVVDPTVAVLGTVPGIVMTSAAGLTVSVSVTGVAAAYVLLPACEAVIWQVPAARIVTTPADVTEHAVPVDEYVGVKPEVAVAPSTGAVPP